MLCSPKQATCIHYLHYRIVPNTLETKRPTNITACLPSIDPHTREGRSRDRSSIAFCIPFGRIASALIGCSKFAVRDVRDIDCSIIGTSLSRFGSISVFAIVSPKNKTRPENICFQIVGRVLPGPEW